MKNQSNQSVELRKQAEEIFQKKAAQPLEDITTLSPEEIKKIFHELSVHQIELEMQKDELLRTHMELDTSRARYFDLYNLASVGYLTLSENGLIMEANLAAATLLSVASRALVKQPFTRFILKEDQDIYYIHRHQRFEPGESKECELRMVKQDGTTLWVHLATTASQQTSEATEYRIVMSDITIRKQKENYREMGREILHRLNDSGDFSDSIQHVLDILKKKTGFDAVGIRLKNEDDFPYFAQRGLSQEFLLLENSLKARTPDGDPCRDKDGNVMLECTCGLVISGKIDQISPLFTPGGSFWTNDSVPLLKIPSSEDPRFHPRNQCIHHNYASTALVPIRAKERIVGLIQFNDRHKGCFAFDSIEILEEIASHIGAALVRKHAEAALQQSEKQLQAINDELERRVGRQTKELQEKQIQYLHAEKLSAIGKLSASIAHEFNNPLQGITSILKGLEKRAILEEEDKELLIAAIDESTRLKNLIHNLQDFNRPSSGRKTIINVHHILDSILLLQKSKFNGGKISVVRNYSENLPLILRAFKILCQLTSS